MKRTVWFLILISVSISAMAQTDMRLRSRWIEDPFYHSVIRDSSAFTDIARTNILGASGWLENLLPVDEPYLKLGDIVRSTTAWWSLECIDSVTQWVRIVSSDAVVATPTPYSASDSITVDEVLLFKTPVSNTNIHLIVNTPTPFKMTNILDATAELVYDNDVLQWNELTLMWEPVALTALVQDTPTPMATPTPHPYSGRYVETIGDGANTTYTISHTFTSQDLLIETRSNVTNMIVNASASIINTTQVVLEFSSALAVDEVNVVIIGETIGGASGEYNTGSNLGDGYNVYKDKSGVSLQFRSIKSVSSHIDIQYATDDNTIWIGGTYPTPFIVRGGDGIVATQTPANADIYVKVLVDSENMMINGSNQIRAKQEADVWNADEIRTIAVTTATPSAGEALIYNSTDGIWDTLGDFVRSISETGSGLGMKFSPGVMGDLVFRSMSAGVGLSATYAGSDTRIEYSINANSGDLNDIATSTPAAGDIFVHNGVIWDSTPWSTATPIPADTPRPTPTPQYIWVSGVATPVISGTTFTVHVPASAGGDDDSVTYVPGATPNPVDTVGYPLDFFGLTSSFPTLWDTVMIFDRLGSDYTALIETKENQIAIAGNTAVHLVGDRDGNGGSTNLYANQDGSAGTVKILLDSGNLLDETSSVKKLYEGSTAGHQFYDQNQVNRLSINTSGINLQSNVNANNYNLVDIGNATASAVEVETHVTVPIDYDGDGTYEGEVGQHDAGEKFSFRVIRDPLTEKFYVWGQSAYPVESGPDAGKNLYLYVEMATSTVMVPPF